MVWDVKNRHMNRHASHAPADAKGPHPHLFLAHWRERVGLTQAQVAEKLGNTDVTIHRWETGKAPVTVKTYFILAELYNAEFPGALMFPPPSDTDAKDLQSAHLIMQAMPADLLRQWLDIGRTLAGSPPNREAEKINTE